MKKLLLTLTALCLCSVLAMGAKKTKVKEHQNPFMTEYTTKYKIPPFQDITYADYVPAVKAGIEQHNQEINAIIVRRDRPDFDNTILALDNSGQLLTKVCYVYYALSESDGTPEMEKISAEIRPLITAHSDEVSMNAELFKKVKEVYDNQKLFNLTRPQQRLLEKTYKSFVRNGALLNDADKARAHVTHRTGAQFADVAGVEMVVSDMTVWCVDDDVLLMGMLRQNTDEKKVAKWLRGVLSHEGACVSDVPGAKAALQSESEIAGYIDMPRFSKLIRGNMVFGKLVADYPILSLLVDSDVRAFTFDMAFNGNKGTINANLDMDENGEFATLLNTLLRQPSADFLQAIPNTMPVVMNLSVNDHDSHGKPNAVPRQPRC